MFLILRLLLLLALASSMVHAKKNQTQKKGSKQKTLWVSLDGLSELDTPPSLNIAETSLSPWEYSLNYNSSRFPSRISEARCLTSGCLSPQGGGEDAALEARPIKYQILVLYRVPHPRKGNKKKRRKYVFKLGTQMVTVGCTCVRPSIIPQL